MFTLLRVAVYGRMLIKTVKDEIKCSIGEEQYGFARGRVEGACSKCFL